MKLDDAIAVQDLKTEDVPTPEWGTDATVTIGQVSAHDMLNWLKEENDDHGGINLLVKCWIEPGGGRIPIENRAAAANALAQKNSDVIGRLVNRCLVLNGLRRDEPKNA